MFSNVALDIVIGLVFVYLLYSLLATVLAEILATKLGLRARNLKEAVDRMLSDEPDYIYRLYTRYAGYFAETHWLIRNLFLNLWRIALYIFNKLYRLFDSIRFMKNPDNERVNNFYAHPEIKYLGSTGLFQNPSSFKAISFSKTLIYLLNGSGPVTRDNIERALRESAPNILDLETKHYVLSLFEDSQGDLVKFKLQLEAWFDRTMEQCTEWYKRKIQVILLIMGFFIAWCFNADTFVIVSKLSTDKDAREKVVDMASAYLQHNPARPPHAFSDSTVFGDSVAKISTRALSAKLDTLLKVKEKLDVDIRNANTLLGAGSWLPDSVMVVESGKYAAIEPDLLSADRVKELKNQKPGKYVVFNKHDKWNYFFALATKHFFGFLLTAIAISLGSPFWFDLLNKLMKLRTSMKQNTTTPKTSADLDEVSPLNREG